MTQCRSSVVGLTQNVCGFDRQKVIPVPITDITIQKKLEGVRAMTRASLGNLPRGNPCAQCGQPIASPDWVEQGQGRISYLWSCRVCDYRFEAIAIFDERQAEPLAA